MKTLLEAVTIFVTAALLSANCPAASWEDYESNGFVSGERTPSHPSGNSLLFTAEKYIALALERGNGDPVGSLEDAYAFSRVLARTELRPGVYARTPEGEPFHADQEGHDDYIGIAAASRILGTDHAREILEHGLQDFFWTVPWPKLYFYYPNQPGPLDWRAWFGRYPATVAHFYYAAGVKPGFWHRLAWAYTVATAGMGDPGAQDPWILSWLMIRTMEGQEDWLTERAVFLWRSRFKKAWPGGIGQVLARYFNNPEHPLAETLRGEGI